jgi:hypothetical protein
VRAYVDKFKEKSVSEEIIIVKDIELFVIEDIFVDAAAEQEIIKNQRNQFNFVEDEFGISSAVIGQGLDADGNSTGGPVGTTANGILLFNQAPGFANNQGNEVSVTYAQTPFFDSGVLVHAQVAVEQINGWHPPELQWSWEPDGVTCPADPLCFLVKRPDHTEPPDRDEDGFPDYVNQYISVFGNLSEDRIDNAFSAASGIVGINQSAGSMNNQDNAVALALGDFAVFALGEIDLGQTNTWNLVDVIDLIRTDTITGASFDNFDGIAMVNQSAGSLNNQANLIDIAVSGSTVEVVLNPGAGLP